MQRKEAETLFFSMLRHTRSVARLKRFLVIVALLLMAALIAWPLINPIEKHLKLSFTEMTEGEAGKPQMLNPKFQGMDDQGQAYKIYADKATQENKETVMLENITGNITLKGDGWIKFSSREGKVKIKESLGYLVGEVRVSSSNQYTLETESAEVDLKKSMARGYVPLAIKGPAGSLEASGFVADSAAGTIVFSGPVKAVVMLKRLEGE